MKDSIKPSEYFENIFKEAVDANFDQLLMVARNDESHLYLLSNGRVKKGITFEKDITGAFVEFFSEKGLPDPKVKCELNVTAAIGLGKCFSVKLTKKTT